MKKHTKILSALLALVMVLALLPAAALAANSEPPYSLPYLKGIENNGYTTTWTYDDEVMDDGVIRTQTTLEIYNDFVGYIENDGDWSKFIARYQKAFRDAGFQEYALDSGAYSYAQDRDENVVEFFIIWDKERSLSIINESCTIVIQHFVATYPEGTTSDGDQQIGDQEQTVKPSLDNFKKSQTYNNQFTDVPAGEWYAPNVQAAYELGLMKGNSDTQFNPTGNISIAETLALACRIHSTYNTGVGDLPAATSGPWYQNYVDYALANAIMYDGQFTDYTAPANRAQFALILASSLPLSALPEINADLSEIPDVAVNTSYAWAVYRLYKAGVLAGSDEYGTFIPYSNISRAESAAIVTRMANPASRVRVELKPVPIIKLYNSNGESVDIKATEAQSYLAQGWNYYADYVCAKADASANSGNYASAVDFVENAMNTASDSDRNTLNAKKSALLAKWQSVNKCPVAILGYTITYNSINIPEVNIKFRNLTDKDITAFEVEWTCIDAYGKVTTDWPTLYNGNFTGYIDNADLKAGTADDYYWTMNSNERTASIRNCHMTRIAFADGTTWK